MNEIVEWDLMGCGDIKRGEDHVECACVDRV